jgi:hypothetical protein
MINGNMTFGLPFYNIIAASPLDIAVSLIALKLGITNTFSYKGLSLSTLWDWWQGGQIYSITAASLLLRGQLKVSENREGLVDNRFIA